jgi:hypothetical protein
LSGFILKILNQEMIGKSEIARPDGEIKLPRSVNALPQ